MFNKVKSIIQTKVQSVKNCCAEKISKKAHEVLDGTVAEAYVDTGVKILIVLVSILLIVFGWSMELFKKNFTI